MRGLADMSLRLMISICWAVGVLATALGTIYLGIILGASIAWTDTQRAGAVLGLGLFLLLVAFCLYCIWGKIEW